MSGVGTDGLAARDHLMTDKVNNIHLMDAEIRSLSDSFHLLRSTLYYNLLHTEKTQESPLSYKA